MNRGRSNHGVEGQGNSRSCRHRRRASAVIEAAVMAPLMIAGTLGITEIGYVYMAKQTVTLSAREGARAGVLPGATQSDAQAAVDATMHNMGFQNYTTTITMGSAADPTVTVVVSLPFNEATFTGTIFGGRQLNLQSSASMRQEGTGN